MGSSRQFSITLSDEMADVVSRKVESGAYASVSDVVCDGVRALMERDDTLEAWLRDEVLPGHAEYLADPSQGVPAGELLGRIKARRAAAQAK